MPKSSRRNGVANGAKKTKRTKIKRKLRKVNGNGSRKNSRIINGSNVKSKWSKRLEDDRKSNRDRRNKLGSIKNIRDANRKRGTDSRRKGSNNSKNKKRQKIRASLSSAAGFVQDLSPQSKKRPAMLPRQTRAADGQDFLAALGLKAAPNRSQQLQKERLRSRKKKKQRKWKRRQIRYWKM